MDGRVLVAYWRLIRPPFHLVGLLPFCVGTLLALQEGGFRGVPFLLGLVAVFLIMLATYLSGEYFDYEGDSLSARMERNRFSGGTQVLQQGLVSRRLPLIVGVLSAVIAGLLGVVLSFPLGYGWGLLALGSIGLLAGVFYSSPPFRWAYRGVGEVLIGFCYGWLPVAVGFYLQREGFVPAVHGVALPIAFSIFNVILVNEFPDYPADRAVGKRNLVVRLGKERASRVYGLVALLTGASLLGTSWWLGVGKGLLAFALLLAALAFGGGWLMVRGWWRGRGRLEGLCALTLGVNLGINALFCIALLP